MSAAAIRARCRSGELREPTSAAGLGFVQANMLIVPAAAVSFAAFCRRARVRCWT